MKINYTVITVGKTRILTIPKNKKYKCGLDLNLGWDESEKISYLAVQFVLPIPGNAPA